MTHTLDFTQQESQQSCVFSRERNLKAMISSHPAYEDAVESKVIQKVTEKSFYRFSFAHEPKDV